MSLSPTIVEGDIIMADLSLPSETIVLKNIAELMEESSHPIQVKDAFLPVEPNSVLDGLTPAVQGGVDPLLPSNYVDQQVEIVTAANANPVTVEGAAGSESQTSSNRVSEKWKNTLRQMIKITNDFLTSSKQLLDEQSAHASEDKIKKNRISRPKKNFGKNNDHNNRSSKRYAPNRNYESYNPNPWRNDYNNR